MKTIEIDNEVYNKLKEMIIDFGETPNLVLRRVLELDTNISETLVTSKQMANKPSALELLLKSSKFKYSKGVVGRFLTILSWIAKDKTEEFSQVTNISGRGRLYFANNREILEKSGLNVNPKQIPNTQFWVITTTDTPKKQRMLKDVMTLLGYDRKSIEIAINSIADKKIEYEMI